MPPSKPNTKSSGSKSKGQNPPQNIQQQQLQQQQQFQQYQGPLPSLDFESLPVESLQKYHRMYRINTPAPMTLDGYMTGSVIGKKTLTARKGGRVSKSVFAAAAKKHYFNMPLKENDLIVDFLYTVTHQDSAFKVQFNHS